MSIAPARDEGRGKRSGAATWTLRVERARVNIRTEVDHLLGLADLYDQQAGQQLSTESAVRLAALAVTASALVLGQQLRDIEADAVTPEDGTSQQVSKGKCGPGLRRVTRDFNGDGYSDLAPTIADARIVFGIESPTTHDAVDWSIDAFELQRWLGDLTLDLLTATA